MNDLTTDLSIFLRAVLPGSTDNYVLTAQGLGIVPDWEPGGGGGGSGDVTGPSASIDNAITRFHLTTGKVIQGGYTSGLEPLLADDGSLYLKNPAGHSIGRAAYAGVNLTIGGTMDPGRECIDLSSEMIVSANETPYAMWSSPTFHTASSGTHAIIANIGLYHPTIVENGATITATAQLFIDGSMISSSANNYAIWVNSGVSRFGDDIGTGTFRVPNFYGTNVNIASAGVLDVASRFEVSSPADGKVKFTNWAGTAGVVFNVTTDGTLLLRNRTDAGAGSLALGAGDLTMTGSLGATGARLTKGWFTDLQVTNAIAGSVTGNAATVTTNANLTGPITSAGNATSIAAQTGTGTTLVVDTSPTVITPTFTTNATVPLVIGGTGNTATLTLKSSSHASSTTGADIVFLVGANGSIEGGRFLNKGWFGVGTASPASLVQVAQNSGTFGTYTSGRAGAVAIDTVMGVTASWTARPSANFPANPFLAQVDISCSGTINTWFPAAFNAILAIKSTDTATYGVGGTAQGGSYQAQYDGSGSQTNLYAIGTVAGVGGTGAVAVLSAGNFACTNVTGASSGTTTLSATILARRPTSISGRVTTTQVGVDIENQTAATAPAGTVIALRTQGTADLISFGSKFTTYNNIATEGLGVPGVFKAPAISATKTANFTVLSYTPPATAGVYRIDGVITTTSSTNSGTVQFTVDYVDSQGTTHTADVVALQDAAGVIATTKTGASKEFHAVSYYLSINNAATAIVLKVVITGTVSYTVAGSVEQVA